MGREHSEIEFMLAGLTPKQREVLDLLIEHKTSKEIGRELGISPHTVDQRIQFAKEKLGASSRSEVAQLYRRLVEICGQLTYQDSRIAAAAAEADTGPRTQAGPLSLLHRRERPTPDQPDHRDCGVSRHSRARRSRHLLSALGADGDVAGSGQLDHLGDRAAVSRGPPNEGDSIMSMPVPVAQMRIARDIAEAERALDEALIRHSSLFTTMVTARRETGSSPFTSTGRCLTFSARWVWPTSVRPTSPGGPRTWNWPASSAAANKSNHKHGA